MSAARSLFGPRWLRITLFARRLPWALLAATFFPSSSGQAHDGHVVRERERFFRLDVGPSEGRLVYALTLAPDHARAVAEILDRDGDHQLQPSDLAFAPGEARLAPAIELWRDGQSVALQWGDAFVDPMGPIKDELLLYELSASFPLQGADILRLRPLEGERYERTELRVGARTGRAFEVEVRGASAEASIVSGADRDAPLALAAGTSVSIRLTPAEGERFEALLWALPPIMLASLGVFTAWRRRSLRRSSGGADGRAP